jgi:hypothetical protein
MVGFDWWLSGYLLPFDFGVFGTTRGALGVGYGKVAVLFGPLGFASTSLGENNYGLAGYLHSLSSIITLVW